MTRTDQGDSFLEILHDLDSALHARLIQKIAANDIEPHSALHPDQMWLELWHDHDMREQVRINELRTVIMKGRDPEDPFAEEWKVTGLAEALVHTPVFGEDSEYAGSRGWAGLVDTITNHHLDLLPYICDTVPVTGAYAEEIIPDSFGTLKNNLGAQTTTQLYGQLQDGRLRSAFRNADLLFLTERIRADEDDPLHFPIEPTFEGWLAVHEAIYDSNYPWAGTIRQVDMCKFQDWTFRCYDPDSPNFNWEKVAQKVAEEGLIFTNFTPQAQIEQSAELIFERIRETMYSTDTTEGWRPLIPALLDGTARLNALQEEILINGGFLEPDDIGADGSLVHPVQLAEDKQMNLFASLAQGPFMAMNQLHPTREGTSGTSQTFFMGLAWQQGLELDWSRSVRAPRDMAVRRIDGILAFNEALEAQMPDYYYHDPIPVEVILEESIPFRGEACGKMTEVFRHCLSARERTIGHSAIAAAQMDPEERAKVGLFKALKETFSVVWVGSTERPDMQPVVLAVDLGGTKTGHGVYPILPNGMIGDEPLFPIESRVTFKGPYNIMETFAAIAQGALTQARDAGYILSGISIAAPDGGEILDIGEADLKQLLHQVIPDTIPIVIQNDGPLQMLGALHRLAGEADVSEKEIAFLGIGTGLAGGFAEVGPDGEIMFKTDGQIWDMTLPYLGNQGLHTFQVANLESAGVWQDGRVLATLMAGRQMADLLDVNSMAELARDLMQVSSKNRTLREFGAYLGELIIMIDQGEFQKRGMPPEEAQSRYAEAAGAEIFVIGGGLGTSEIGGQYLVPAAVDHIRQQARSRPELKELAEAIGHRIIVSEHSKELGVLGAALATPTDELLLQPDQIANAVQTTRSGHIVNF